MLNLLRVILFAAFGLFAAGQAQAKLIAIVFDTSGSMGNRFHLPSFGMQMLAATIDGRAGEDRVWTINFHDYVERCAGPIPEASTLSQLSCDTSSLVRKFDVTSGSIHSNMLETMEQEFQAADVGTPFGPLEVMLDEIAKGIDDGEEVILIVVTDGAYEVINDQGDTVFDDGAYIPQFKRSFETHQQRIRDAGGSIRAEFLFIDSDGDGERKVREQGVRDTLLSTFNSDQNEGAWHVTGASALWAALTEITARVNDTDLEQQRPFIEYEGNQITITSPLSLSRVGIVFSGRGSAPISVANDFEVALLDKRRLDRRMNSGDQLFNDLRLDGAVEHLWFENPVPPGRYTLTFDGPVDQNTFLFFETNAIARLQVLDDQGATIQPKANGNYELFVGSNYTFTTEILDGAINPTVVDLATLPTGLAMFLALEGQTINATQSMTLDIPSNVGHFDWRPSDTGALQASSRVSAGILSPVSEPLNIVVLDAASKIVISPIRPTFACSNCSNDEITSPVVSSGGEDVEIGSFDLTTVADIPGALIIDPESIPDGYRIVDGTGQGVPLGQALPFGLNETRTFTIFRPAQVNVDDLSAGGTDINIKVTPAGAWTGNTVARQTRLKLTPPEMGMRLVAVTQPITPGTVDGLLVPDTELRRGQFLGQFGLVDLLQAPQDSDVDDLVTVKADGLAGQLISFNTSFPNSSVHALDVRPKTGFWCLCFLGIGNYVSGSDAVDARVSYTLSHNGTVLQAAQSNLPMRIPIRHSQTSLSCLLNLIYFLLFVMFIRGLIALATTHRFPKGAVVEISDGANLPRFKRLDKGNTVWRKAWFALFTGNPNERRTIEGLTIEATRKGAKVDIDKKVPPWELERMGETFSELKENNPKKTVYPLIWGDRLENVYRPSLSMRLKRKSSD